MKPHLTFFLLLLSLSSLSQDLEPLLIASVLEHQDVKEFLDKEFKSTNPHLLFTHNKTTYRFFQDEASGMVEEKEIILEKFTVKKNGFKIKFYMDDISFKSFLIKKDAGFEPLNLLVRNGGSWNNKRVLYQF